MSSRTLNLTDTVYEYLLTHSLREHASLRRLREETAGHRWAKMQISPEQGQFMALLVKLMQAERIIELGVFTGYSSLAMALAMPAGGKLLACDVNEDYTRIAQKYWREAGVADSIELRLAPALETLDALLDGGGAGTFDVMFVDAVKEEYPEYYERAVRLLRPGGLIAVDNVLWGGSVADDGDRSAETRALRRFNAIVHADERVDMSMLPIGDGLTLARLR